MNEENEKWTNVMMDSQILSSFMSCPRKMKLQFIDHLVPIQGPSAGILRGSLIHYGLQEYYTQYKAGNELKERVRLGLAKMREKAGELNLTPDDSLLVYRTFEQYCEYKASEIVEVVGVEQEFAEVIYEEYPIRIIYKGRIDLLTKEDYLNKGRSLLVATDFKSESEAWFYSTLKNQFMGYALVTKNPMMYIQRIGFQKSKGPEQKFAREILQFDPDVLEEFRSETIPHYARQLLIASEEGYFPPNHTSCITGHFACQFSDKYYGGVCSIKRDIRKDKLDRYFTYKEWDPSLEI